MNRENGVTEWVQIFRREDSAVLPLSVHLDSEYELLFPIHTANSYMLYAATKRNLLQYMRFGAEGCDGLVPIGRAGFWVLDSFCLFEIHNSLINVEKKRRKSTENVEKQ